MFWGGKMLKKGLRELKKGADKVSDVIDKAVAKDATSPHRDECKGIEHNMKQQLEAITGQVRANVEAWQRYFTLNPNATDKATVEQSLAGFNTQLAVLAKIFSNPNPQDTDATGIKEMAWQIHEISGSSKAKDECVSECDTRLVIIRAMNQLFISDHKQLSAELIASRMIVDRRITALEKISELSAKIEGSRGKWQPLLGNTYQPINAAAVATALAGLDTQLASLSQLSGADFDTKYQALSELVAKNIAAREKLEATIEQKKAEAEAATKAKEVDALANSFLAFSPAAKGLEEDADGFEKVDPNEADATQGNTATIALKNNKGQ
jgi:hypothetical protein